MVRWNTGNKEILIHAAWHYLENGNCIPNLNYQDTLNLILRINNYYQLSLFIKLESHILNVFIISELITTGVGGAADSGGDGGDGSGGVDAAVRSYCVVDDSVRSGVYGDGS